MEQLGAESEPKQMVIGAAEVKRQESYVPTSSAARHEPGTPPMKHAA